MVPFILMGRRKQPTEVLKLRGTFDKNPKRLKARNREPKAVAGTPRPPNHLNRVGKAAFRAVVTSLKELNCLSKTDKHAIELYAIAYQELRSCEKPSDVNALTNACGRLLCQMGLTPSARASVKANADEQAAVVESRSFLRG